MPPRLTSATPGPSTSANSTTEGQGAVHLNKSTLLPFHRTIIRSLVPGTDDPPEEGDALLLLARGLGLRRVVSTILRIYDGPRNLVVLVSASQEEEAGLGEELTTLGVRKPGLRIIHHEMSAKQRQEIYLSGGILSVTSRILVVDMLNKRIPTGLITGLVVLHAEKVSPTSVEAFIVRIYRQENKDGFLKAFSDEPEHFATGISPLQTVMGQLQVRKVELWPRFHQQASKDLGQRKADVIELHQPLSRPMRDIQTAIVECMDATLAELKRSNAAVDVDDYTIENAIFRAFDVLVRRQLDSVWHRIGPKTKQLVNDLTTLRSLLNYLLEYDAVTFNSFLETILASNSTTTSGAPRRNQSPWLFMDAANTIFSEAKHRVFLGTISNQSAAQKGDERSNGTKGSNVATAIDVEAEEDAFADEEEAMYGERASAAKGDGERSRKKNWLPPGIEPVLEELPKWNLLREVLDEIEQEIHFTATDLTGPINNTILVMTGSDRTCSQIREYLSTMDDWPDATPGRRMMERMLRNYFFWKGGLGQMNANLNHGSGATGSNGAQPGSAGEGRSRFGGNSEDSEALKRKAVYNRGQVPPGKRRRIRGGSFAASLVNRHGAKHGPASLEHEASEMAQFVNGALTKANADLGEEADLDDAPADSASIFTAAQNNTVEDLDEVEFDSFFGVLSMENLVVVRPYKGDEDDKVLQELRPRYIVVYDPDPAFVRRVEIYRSTNPGFGVRVYFLMYADSVEEQRYLSSLRREKESFERLIREKAIMALPLQADGRPAPQDADERLLRTISSRIAGGQRTATNEPPRVIVDMREFRSSLPSLLHAADIQVIPCTLQVGDYILTPSMCVERKSLPDLVQSFNSGRLYTQCELMSIHYKHPILLIEFDQDKSFSLQTVSETKSNPRSTITRSAGPSDIDIQSKLVLLTSAFPRLRVIWSSSPYATADIFADLKSTYEEPDVTRVAAIGLDEATDPVALGGGGGGGASSSEQAFNLTPQDVLRAMPGINTKNYRYVMTQVRDMAELCDLTLEEIQELIGVEPGKQLFQFINRDVKKEGTG